MDLTKEQLHINLYNVNHAKIKPQPNLTPKPKNAEIAERTKTYK